MIDVTRCRRRTDSHSDNNPLTSNFLRLGSGPEHPCPESSSSRTGCHTPRASPSTAWRSSRRAAGWPPPSPARTHGPRPSGWGGRAISPRPRPSSATTWTDSSARGVRWRSTSHASRWRATTTGSATRCCGRCFTTRSTRCSSMPRPTGRCTRRSMRASPTPSPSSGARATSCGSTTTSCRWSPSWCAGACRPRVSATSSTSPSRRATCSGCCRGARRSCAGSWARTWWASRRRRTGPTSVARRPWCWAWISTSISWCSAIVGSRWACSPSASTSPRSWRTPPRSPPRSPHSAPKLRRVSSSSASTASTTPRASCVASTPSIGCCRASPSWRARSSWCRSACPRARGWTRTAICGRGPTSWWGVSTRATAPTAPRRSTSCTAASPTTSSSRCTGRRMSCW